MLIFNYNFKTKTEFIAFNNLYKMHFNIKHIYFNIN